MKELEIKVKHNSYIHLASFEVNSILELVAPDSEKIEIVVADKTYKVNVKSLRLLCFKESQTCVVCGKIGTIITLNRNVNDKQNAHPHFNLFADNLDGTFNLMTKDHICPKSKGGKNHLSNLQTMCKICNEKKGSNYEIEL